MSGKKGGKGHVIFFFFFYIPFPKKWKGHKAQYLGKLSPRIFFGAAGLFPFSLPE